MSTRILAIDTTTEACSVALLINHEISASYELGPREHAQRILPMVQQLLGEAEIGLTQLDAIAFSCGPGSFTGVRIGIGITQGLAFGADLAVLPISTLKTLAQGAYRLTQATQVLAAMDARMGELYWGQYHRQPSGAWWLVDQEAVLQPGQVMDHLNRLNGSWHYAGSGWQSYPDLLSHFAPLMNGQITLPHAQDILPLAHHDWLLGKGLSVDAIEPVYLRNEVTWKKLPGR